jgi:hypothetical protein
LAGLNRVLGDLPTDPAVGCPGVAARHGYADQSHLVREFRALAGLTPDEYLARGGASLHVAAAG